MNTNVLNNRKSLGYFLLLIISFFLCTNNAYGVQNNNVYMFHIENLLISYNGDHKGKETPIKIVNPEGETTMIKNDHKMIVFKLDLSPNQQPINRAEDIVSKEYCEINGQKNAFLISKKDADQISEALLKADKDIEINIGSQKDDNEEAGTYYVLIVDVTSRVKEKVQKEMEETKAGLFEPLNEKRFKICIYAADTANVTDMSNMFSLCTLLKGISGLEKFNTGNVKDMSGMFSGCSSLKQLPNDISKWDTSKVEDMSYMFSRCGSLASLPDISKWDTSNVTDMSWMFLGCSSLTKINLDGWNIENVNIFNAIFEGCSKLEIGISTLDEKIKKFFSKDCKGTSITLDVSGIDISKCKINKTTGDMSNMFEGCIALTGIKGLDKLVTKNVTNIRGIFKGCKNLKTIEGIEKWITTNVTNMSLMFYRCSSLISLPDISKWDTSNVTDMSWMFSGCSSLIKINLDGWNIDNNKIFTAIFKGCSNLEIKTSEWDERIKKFFSKDCKGTSITLDVSGIDISKCKINKITGDMSNMFEGCIALTGIKGLDKLVTKNVTNIRGIFKECKNLKTIEGIEKWITTNVTNMSFMFYRCSSLISLPDISKWDTSNVTNMEEMFYICKSLTKLPDISKWEKGKVKDMSYMFSGCKNFKNIEEMFYDCKSLTKLPDIPKWKKGKIKDISSMFYGYEKLKKIEGINNCDTKEVTNTDSI